MRVKKNKVAPFPHKIKKSLPFIRYSVLVLQKKCWEKNLDPWDILLIQYLENKALRGRLYGCHENLKEREKAAWGTQDFNSVKGNQTK